LELASNPQLDHLCGCARQASQFLKSRASKAATLFLTGLGEPPLVCIGAVEMTGNDELIEAAQQVVNSQQQKMAVTREAMTLQLLLEQEWPATQFEVRCEEEPGADEDEASDLLGIVICWDWAVGPTQLNVRSYVARIRDERQSRADFIRFRR
jgi:hypothetical protein